jgi:AraC-like DNA-binding protein
VNILNMFNYLLAKMKTRMNLRIYKIFALAAILLLSTAYAYSQPKYDTPPQPKNSVTDGFALFGLGFQVALPRAEYLQHNNHTGYGVGITLGYDFPDSYISAGIDGMLAIYSSQTRVEPWSTTIPDAKLNVETSNQIAAGHLFLRLQPGTGFIRPYVEGDFGFNYLWTDTKVSSQNNTGSNGENKDIATSVDISDIALSVGFSNQQRFNEMFKKYAGQTPLQYRKKH